MIVNLFDDAFRHDVCSTAWKTPTHVAYVRDQIEFDGVTLFTDGYINLPIVDKVESRYKIGWLHEPECLHPDTYADSLANLHKFAFILTYYAPLLEMAGYRFAPYAGTWIPEDRWGILPKTKLVSMLFGTKMSTEGHRIRPAIADAVDGRVADIRFYGARGEPVDYSPETKYRVLADYAFSIVVETCRQDNLFTEILLDCFTVGTVPIFWGAPNVGEFFNAEGVLSFETVEECSYIVESLSFAVYEFMARAITDNFERVRRYAITEDWLYENVLKDLVP